MDYILIIFPLIIVFFIVSGVIYYANHSNDRKGVKKKTSFSNQNNLKLASYGASNYSQNVNSPSYSQNITNPGYSQNVINPSYSQNIVNPGYSQNIVNPNLNQRPNNYSQNIVNPNNSQNIVNPGYSQNVVNPNFGQRPNNYSQNIVNPNNSQNIVNPGYSQNVVNPNFGQRPNNYSQNIVNPNNSQNIVNPSFNNNQSKASSNAPLTVEELLKEISSDFAGDSLFKDEPIYTPNNYSQNVVNPNFGQQPNNYSQNVVNPNFGQQPNNYSQNVVNPNFGQQPNNYSQNVVNPNFGQQPNNYSQNVVNPNFGQRPNNYSQNVVNPNFGQRPNNYSQNVVNPNFGQRPNNYSQNLNKKSLEPEEQSVKDIKSEIAAQELKDREKIADLDMYDLISQISSEIGDNKTHSKDINKKASPKQNLSNNKPNYTQNTPRSNYSQNIVTPVNSYPQNTPMQNKTNNPDILNQYINRNESINNILNDIDTDLSSNNMFKNERNNYNSSFGQPRSKNQGNNFDVVDANDMIDTLLDDIDISIYEGNMFKEPEIPFTNTNEEFRIGGIDVAEKKPIDIDDSYGKPIEHTKFINNNDEFRIDGVDIVKEVVEKEEDEINGPILVEKKFRNNDNEFRIDGIEKEEESDDEQNYYEDDNSSYVRPELRHADEHGPISIVSSFDDLEEIEEEIEEESLPNIQVVNTYDSIDFNAIEEAASQIFIEEDNEAVYKDIVNKEKESIEIDSISKQEEFVVSEMEVEDQVILQDDIEATLNSLVTDKNVMLKYTKFKHQEEDLDLKKEVEETMTSLVDNTPKFESVVSISQDEIEASLNSLVTDKNVMLKYTKFNNKETDEDLALQREIEESMSSLMLDIPNSMESVVSISQDEIEASLNSLAKEESSRKFTKFERTNNVDTKPLIEKTEEVEIISSESVEPIETAIINSDIPQINLRSDLIVGMDSLLDDEPLHDVFSSDNTVEIIPIVSEEYIEEPVFVQEQEEIIEPVFVQEQEEIIEPVFVQEQEEIIEPIFVQEQEETIEPIFVQEQEETIEPIFVQEQIEDVTNNDIVIDSKFEPIEQEEDEEVIESGNFDLSFDDFFGDEVDNSQEDSITSVYVEPEEQLIFEETLFGEELVSKNTNEEEFVTSEYIESEEQSMYENSLFDQTEEAPQEDYVNEPRVYRVQYQDEAAANIVITQDEIEQSLLEIIEDAKPLSQNLDEAYEQSKISLQERTLEEFDLSTIFNEYEVLEEKTEEEIFESLVNLDENNKIVEEEKIVYETTLEELALLDDELENVDTTTLIEEVEEQDLSEIFNNYNDEEVQEKTEEPSYLLADEIEEVEEQDLSEIFNNYNDEEIQEKTEEPLYLLADEFIEEIIEEVKTNVYNENLEPLTKEEFVFEYINECKIYNDEKELYDQEELMNKLEKEEIVIIENEVIISNLIILNNINEAIKIKEKEEEVFSNVFNEFNKPVTKEELLKEFHKKDPHLYYENKTKIEKNDILEKISSEELIISDDGKKVDLKLLIKELKDKKTKVYNKNNEELSKEQLICYYNENQDLYDKYNNYLTREDLYDKTLSDLLLINDKENKKISKEQILKELFGFIDVYNKNKERITINELIRYLDNQTLNLYDKSKKLLTVEQIVKIVEENNIDITPYETILFGLKSNVLNDNDITLNKKEFIREYRNVLPKIYNLEGKKYVKEDIVDYIQDETIIIVDNGQIVDKKELIEELTANIYGLFTKDKEELTKEELLFIFHSETIYDFYGKVIIKDDLFQEIKNGAVIVYDINGKYVPKEDLIVELEKEYTGVYDLFHNPLTKDDLITQLNNNNKIMYDDTKKILHNDEIIEILNKNNIENIYKPLLSEKEQQRPFLDFSKAELKEIVDDEYIETLDVVLARKENDKIVIVNYNESYEARLNLTNDTIKDYYTALKNKILSFNQVKSKILWSGEMFTAGKKNVAKIDIENDKMYLYLPLNWQDFINTRFKYKDCSNIKGYETTPLRFKINSIRELLDCFEFIDEVAMLYNLSRISDFVQVNYYEKNRGFDKLLKEKLIKEAINSKRFQNLTQIDKETLISNKITSISKEVIMDIPLNEELEKEVLSNVTKVENPKRKGLISIDTISKTYHNNDVVTLQSLKDKNLIHDYIDSVKCISSGSLDKKLFFELQDYSKNAIKMILLTNGKIK